MSSIPEEEFSRVEVVLGNGHRLVIPQATVRLNHHPVESPLDWEARYIVSRTYYTLDVGKFYDYAVIPGSGKEDTPIYDRLIREAEYYD